MKNTSLKIKILSVMLCTGLALSGASLSFAAVKNNDSANEKIATSMDIKVPMNTKKIKEERHAEMKVTFEIVIKESVAKGIISKDEGKKVLEYANLKSHKKSGECKKHKKHTKEKDQCTKGGLFYELETDHILTKEQCDAIRERLFVKYTEIRTEKLQKGLDTLVANKVLTTEQCNKVKEAIMAREAERKENYNKMRGMTEEERENYMKKMKESKESPLKVLLDKNIITKEQKNEIQKILPHYKNGKHGGRGHHWNK